jgi:hypothetical protein
MVVGVLLAVAPVELLEDVLLLLLVSVDDALSAAAADLEALASSDALADLEKSADRLLSELLEAEALADSEADLLELASSEESRLELVLTDRLSVLVWLRVRLWS